MIEHGYLLSFSLQIETWHEQLVSEIENVVEEGDVVEVEDDRSQRTTLFEVQVKALLCARAPETYRSDLRVRSLKHTSVADPAICFWQNGLPAGEMLGSVDYMGVWDAASAQPALTNVFINLP